MRLGACALRCAFHGGVCGRPSCGGQPRKRTPTRMSAVWTLSAPPPTAPCRADGIEQSECWAPFRMARSARCWGKRLGEFEVRGCMVDWAGNRIERTVWLGEDGRLAVVDAADPSVRLVSRFHLLGVSAEGPELCESCYCPEFGKALRSTCAEGYGAGSIAAVIDLASRDISWDCDR